MAQPRLPIVAHTYPHSVQTLPSKLEQQLFSRHEISLLRCLIISMLVSLHFTNGDVRGAHFVCLITSITAREKGKMRMKQKYRKNFKVHEESLNTMILVKIFRQFFTDWGKKCFFFSFFFFSFNLLSNGNLTPFAGFFFNFYFTIPLLSEPLCVIYKVYFLLHDGFCSPFFHKILIAELDLLPP